MSYGVSMIVLLAAAVLEAGGDALMRGGLHAPSLARRLLFLLAGSVVLALYGYTVNAPPWEPRWEPPGRTTFRESGRG